MASNRLGRSMVYRGFRKTLVSRFGEEKAAGLWQDANRRLADLSAAHRDLPSDARMMVLPAAALYAAMQETVPEEALPMLVTYGRAMGEKLGRIIHGVTCIPFLPELLWKHMPALMRKMSAPEKGYSRFIVAESAELVGVDILSCPIHDAAVTLGMPEVATVVCAMDKAYMTGFRRIRYTRTTSVAEGDGCCDYRLSYDKSKK